ncbi:cyclin-like protein isoform X2 [Wolffia australiana]
MDALTPTGRRFAWAAPPMTAGNPPPGQYWYPPPPHFPHPQHQPRPSPWAPPSDHGQQFRHPSPFPPVAMQFPPQHGTNPSPFYPPPLPSQSFAPPPPAALPPAYPQPNQMWENSPWHGAQGWNYADNFQYNNGEDWATRARAWAASNSAVQSQFSSLEAPNNHYNESYQHSAVPTLSHDGQLSTASASEEHIPDAGADTNRKLSKMPGTFPNAVQFAAKDESATSGWSAVIGPPQQSFTSSTSVNVQEVSSSYSSSSANKEAKDRLEKLHMPIGQPQAFEQISLEQAQIQNAFSINMEQAGSIKQGTSSPSVLGYAQAAGPVPVPLFPHVSPVPPGPQFELPSQAFGRIQQPNFQSPFNYDVGPPHPVTAFPVDTVETYNLSERPKKTAVPNWLRDEIIKKKASIVGPSQEHPSEHSHATATHVHKKDTRNEEPVDQKGIDSSKSSEDEDDDEDDADEARQAAINLEIKRVLTDVLLKVTDELFEEIATKVLNEDESEGVHVANVGKQRDSTSPPPSATSKTPAKVVRSSAPAIGNSDGATLIGISNSGGAILGLADYSSDDDEDGSEEIQRANPSFPAKVQESVDQILEREEKKEGHVGNVSSEEHVEVSLGLDSNSKIAPSLSNGNITGQEKTKLGPLKTTKAPENRNDSEMKDLVKEKPHVELDKGITAVKEVESTVPKSNKGTSLSGVPTTKTNHDDIPERVHQSSVPKRVSKDDVDDRKASAVDRRGRLRDDGDGRKRETRKDEREERFRDSEKDLRKQKKGRTSPPINENSESDDEVMESSRKRKLHSRRPSLSPSPTRPRRRRSRSGSRSPGQRWRSGRRRQ